MPTFMFYEISQLLKTDKVNQIIVIGDAPANKYDEIVKHRNKFYGYALLGCKVPLLATTEACYEGVKKGKS